MSFASFAKQHIPRYQPPVQEKPKSKFIKGSLWKYLYSGKPSTFTLVYDGPENEAVGLFQYSTAYPNGERFNVLYTSLVPA